MRIINRERVSTKNSLHNTCGRAHLDGRAFRNDPDVFFLRDDVRLTDEQRSRLLEADATLGGVFFTSDDMGLWSDDQRAAFEAALAKFVARADKE
jgi:alpha-galactosidase